MRSIQHSQPGSSHPSVSTPTDDYPGIQPVSIGLGLGASVNPAHAQQQPPSQQHHQHQHQQLPQQMYQQKQADNGRGKERNGSVDAHNGNGLTIPTVQVTPQREREGSFASQIEFDDSKTGNDAGGFRSSKSSESLATRFMMLLFSSMNILWLRQPSLTSTTRLPSTSTLES